MTEGLMGNAKTNAKAEGKKLDIGLKIFTVGFFAVIILGIILIIVSVSFVWKAKKATLGQNIVNIDKDKKNGGS